jgi:ABC-type transporter Mla subunit MlaD
VKVQRNDLFVGLFVILAAAGVVAALVATSGWGTKHFDMYILSDNTTGISVDTKIYMQGLEIGRVAGIAPSQAGRQGQLRFVLLARMIQQFPNGAELHLPRNVVAQVETSVLGASTLFLVPDTSIHTRGAIEAGDTVPMFRQTTAVEAFGALARDLKGSIQGALAATTDALHSIKKLADSLAATSGTARGFVASVQPRTQQILQEVATSLQRMRVLLDSVDVRSAVSMRQVDSTLAQSRKLMASADSLTKLVTAMGGENRPEVRAILVNSRLLTEQLLYVTEQLSKRPMRALSGIQLPDSLTPEGRARRAAQDSLLNALRRDSLRRDSVRPEPRP